MRYERGANIYQAFFTFGYCLLCPRFIMKLYEGATTALVNFAQLVSLSEARARVENISSMHRRPLLRVTQALAKLTGVVNAPPESVECTSSRA